LKGWYHFKPVSGTVLDWRRKKEISVPNCRAREIEYIYNNEEAITTARFILRGNDIFTLLVTTKSSYKSNDDLHKFLNSFKLLN